MTPLDRQSTTKQVDDPLEALKKALIEPAATLYAVQQVHGDNIRERTKRSYRRLLDAHLLASGVLGAYLLRVNGKMVPYRENDEQRDALFASYVIGLKICEDAIEEGRYIQAHALLRQEMETLAQLKAVRAGKRKDNQSPNISIFDKSLARYYGELSATAHLAKHHIVRTATELEIPESEQSGDRTAGTRYFPEFDENVARRTFAIHLMLTLKVLEELGMDSQSKPVDEGFTALEVKAVDAVVDIMIEEGMLERI